MEIDKDLVEKIAREVISRLSSASGFTASPASSGSLLAVLTCGVVGIDEAVTQLQKSRAEYSSLTVFLAQCADGKSGEEISNRVRPDRVLRATQGATVDQALEGAAAVVYPNCTMTLAAKIGLLISDSPTTTIAVSALVRRLPVTIATNSMLASLAKGDYVPPEFQAVGAEHIQRLGRVGVRTCDIRELAASTSGASGGSVAASSASATAFRAAPVSFAPDTPASAAPASAAIQCQPVLRDLEAFVRSSLADDPSCQPCAAKLHAAIEKCIEAGACRIGTAGITDTAHGNGGVAGMIDHTLLKANATPQEVEKLCAEARQYKFKSVCINPGYIAMCKRLLQGSGVLVCTVVGFPLGATTTGAKAAETRDAIADGADEIDMVINIGMLKAGEYAKVKYDMEEVVQAAKGRTVKVILETHFLTDEEKVAACQLAVAAGVEFVKTSTGFGGGGATVEDIALMRKVVGPNLGVKASGGVRTKEDAEKMIKAGASRIGASASIAIATGKKTESKGY